MSEKLSSDLVQKLDEVDADAGVPVIVTVRPGADVSELERHGLEIRHRYESIPSVAGVMKAGRARELAELDAIERIEGDEPEVRAL